MVLTDYGGEKMSELFEIPEEIYEEDYMLSVEKLFDWICEFYGYDWGEVMSNNSFKGTLNSYGLQKALFDIWSYIQGGDIFLAWDLSVSLIKDMIQEERVKNPSDVDEVRKLSRFLFTAAEYIEQYQSIEQAGKKQWDEFLQTLTLLTKEEKLDMNVGTLCRRSLRTEVDRVLLDPRILRICRYKGNGDLKMNKLRSWIIGENFIMAENVSSLFLLNREGEEDVLKVYITLNIERHLDYSYFLIAINQGENWWMVTDEADFANPSAKEGIARRSAARFRESNFEKSIFPYVYLDKIEDYRNQNKLLEKENNQHREMYTVPLKEWPVQCRVMLELLLQGVVRKITGEGGQLANMKFGSEFMANDRLLTGDVKNALLDELDKEFDYSEKSGYMRERVKEMILRREGSSSIVKVNKGEFSSDMALFSNSLMSEEKYRKIQAWALCKEEYENRKKALEITEAEKIEDIKTYSDMLDRNIHHRFEMLFAARKMWVFIYEPGVVYDENPCIGLNHKAKIYLTGLHSDSFWPMYHAKVAGGLIDETCRYCNNHPLKEHHVSGVRVTHWSMLAWLAGVKRDELPFYFRNYASEFFHVYIGNTLLSNINPLYSLKDEMSSKYTNGVQFGIRVCKRCRNSLHKRAFEEGVLVIDKSTCSAEGVFEMEDFKNNWLPSKGLSYKMVVKSL